MICDPYTSYGLNLSIFDVAIFRGFAHDGGSACTGPYGPFIDASMCLLFSEGSGIVTECMLIVVVIFICLSCHGSLHR